MKSNKLVLTCLVLVTIAVISEAGNVMRKHSNPSRQRTGRLGHIQRRQSPSRSNPGEHRLSRTDAVHRRQPAEIPVRPASPSRGSSGSRSQSPGASSMEKSQPPKYKRRRIPKIVITPPDDESPRTPKTNQKKVSFSDPLVNIRYTEPNPIRRRRQHTSGYKYLQASASGGP